MKTQYLKCSALLIAALAITFAASAQKNDSAKRTFNFDRHNNSDVTNYTADGKRHEHITTNWKGTYYEAMLVNDKMTELYVEGEKIPQANWAKYSTVITRIREQIRKDRIQAQKDQAQARLDQIQARKDQEQAVRDQEKEQQDQAQERVDQQEAEKDQEQARKDQQQAEEEAQRAQEQAKRAQAQAKLDQEQAMKDQEH